MLLSRGRCTTSGRWTTAHLPAVLGQARPAWSRYLAHAKAGAVGNRSCVAAGAPNSKVSQPTEESARLDGSGPPGRGPPANFHTATGDGSNGPNGPSGPRHQQGGWLSWAGACIVTCLAFGIQHVFKPVALLVAIVWAADVLGGHLSEGLMAFGTQGSRVASPSTSAAGSISCFLPPSRCRSGGGSWSLATTLGAAIGGGLTALAITVGLGLAFGGGGNEASRNRDSRRRRSLSGGENGQMGGALPSG